MKNRKILVGALVLILLIAGGVFVWRNQRTGATATSAAVQTATVQRGSIIATINAAGNISTPQVATLAFQTSGRVAKVQVQVGDVVKKGQLLMQLDKTDLGLALKLAQTNLISSQAKLDAEKAQAAQIPNSLIIARAQLDKATVTLQQAQGEYNKVAWRADVGMTSQAATLQQATIDYQTALANYNTTVATINDSTLKQAQAQYERDQVAVEQAQRNLDQTDLFAPFDGVVAQVNYNVGDSAGSSAAVVVADTSQLEIKVSVAEVDMPKVKEGNPAQVTLDALLGKTYNAQVTTIGPVGTITQGVVNYPVTFKLNDADDSIKPGMTANLTVVVERREDVLLVPTRAVRTQGNQRTVTVVVQGQLIPTSVRTGLAGDQMIEITSGLKEGDVVVVSQTQTQTGNVPGGVGIPFLGIR
jgi:RND family efflux transporter MFP subunit